MDREELKSIVKEILDELLGEHINESINSPAMTYAIGIPTPREETMEVNGIHMPFELVKKWHEQMNSEELINNLPPRFTVVKELRKLYNLTLVDALDIVNYITRVPYFD